jgi:hypothetical protein
MALQVLYHLPLVPNDKNFHPQQQGRLGMKLKLITQFRSQTNRPDVPEAPLYAAPVHPKTLRQRISPVGLAIPEK